MNRQNEIEMKLSELKPSIRVCLLVENRLLRETLVHLLQKKAGITVVGKDYSAERLAETEPKEPFDVMLVDTLDSGCVKDFWGEMEARFQRPKVVFFGMDLDPECFLRAIRRGARAYLLKDASSEEIVSAVRRVAEGEAVCPPKLCIWLFNYVASEGKAVRGSREKNHAAKPGLTYRQRQLMALVAVGMTNKEIANKLHLSEFTVKNHVARVMRQLNADSRHEAANLILGESAVEAFN
jgi:two-component system, NarL family, response regulator DevR